MVDIVIGYDDRYYDEICRIEEFNATVAEMSEGFEEYKREYEMDKVETVTVDGMVYEIGKLYEFSDTDTNRSEIGELTAAEDDICTRLKFRSRYGNKEEWFHKCEPISHKNGTITPAPVELIDGKAYQFDYSDEGSAAGFYDKEKDSFRILSIEMESEYCTNIIPLVPEVK